MLPFGVCGHVCSSISFLLTLSSSLPNTKKLTFPFQTQSTSNFAQACTTVLQTNLRHRRRCLVFGFGFWWFLCLYNSTLCTLLCVVWACVVSPVFVVMGSNFVGGVSMYGWFACDDSGGCSTTRFVLAKVFVSVQGVFQSSLFACQNNLSASCDLKTTDEQLRLRTWVVVGGVDSAMCCRPCTLSCSHRNPPKTSKNTSLHSQPKNKKKGQKVPQTPLFRSQTPLFRSPWYPPLLTSFPHSSLLSFYSVYTLKCILDTLLLSPSVAGLWPTGVGEVA